jgi:perosamine synthetase
LPQEAPWARHVYWLYTILVENRFHSAKHVGERLASRGIETRPFFYPISSMPPYRNGSNGRFAVAERVSKNGLSLPSSPLLKEEHVRKICAVIRELVDGARTKKRVSGRQVISRGPRQGLESAAGWCAIQQTLVSRD